MVKERRYKVANDLYLQLEDSIVHGDLIEVKTSKKYRKEMIEKIRGNITFTSGHPDLSLIKDELLDIAVVIYITPMRYRRQDLDNVAKIVLDALTQRNKEDQDYLFKDDCQIVRLLLYKKQRIELPEADTSQMSISIRKPEYANNFLAVWENKDKNGKTYLSIRLFGSYINVFQTRQE